MYTVAYDTTHGDCEYFLDGVPDEWFDVIFLDPPYNTGNNKSKYSKIKKLQDKKWDNFHADWDTIENYQEWAYGWLTKMRRTIKKKGSAFICGSYHNFPELGVAAKQAGYYIVTSIAWCIPNSMFNAAMTEMVHANQLVYWLRPHKDITHYYDKDAAKRINGGKNLRDYWIIPNRAQRKTDDKPWLQHPSKKPIELVERCIDITMPKVNWSRIGDFFAGSGTTGEAVWNIAQRYNLNLHCSQGDKNEEYVRNILARIEYNHEMPCKGSRKAQDASI